MQMVARFLLRNLDVEFTVADPGLWHELLDRYTSISDPSRYLNEIRKVPRADRASRLLADGIPMPVVDTARRLAADRTGLRPPALSPSIAERAAECERFADAVRACGATAMVDLHDLHASEFHDGPAFTVRQRGGPLLGDGGSYGQYATRLTGRTTTAHSVVIGLERLADLLHAQATNGRPTADVALLIATDPEVDDYAENLVWELRDVGLKVWDITIDRALSHHLRSIAELRIPYSIIVGARELRSTDCAVRDLAGQIRAVPRRGLAEWLRERAASGIEQPT